jgi:hypothetical protein
VAQAEPSPGTADLVKTAPSVQLAVDGPSPAAAGPAAAAAPAGQSEKELDDLARKLYGHLRAQLRFELLIDRERAGLLTDWR